MKRYRFISLCCFFLLLLNFFIPTSLFADGIIIPIPIPDPPRPIPEPKPYINIKSHEVEVTIENQVAHTHIDQVFHNPYNYAIEGTYIFPVPERAIISHFALIADGVTVNATLLEKDEARKIYEEIVRKQKDPALLEYAGQSLYKASLYPIPGHGERTIIIDYTELLEKEDSLISYRYPLNTEKYSRDPLEIVKIDITLISEEEIKSIYSPSHEIDIHQQNGFHATAEYEAEDVKPDKDFLLYYTVSEGDIGFTLLTHKTASEDGFFLGMVAPSIEDLEDVVVPKNILFIIDTSGSMYGEKITQAKESLKFCLNNLNPEDSFNIITFSSTISPLRDELMKVSGENIESAMDEVSRLQAAGSTDINNALLEGLTQLTTKEGPNMVIFLTDGLPTRGETRIENILENVESRNDSNTRIFVFGLGYDVDIHFLDKLSEQNRGISDYVRPSENVEEKVTSFYSKVQYPILANLKLNFGSFNTYDVYPVELPDLFKGSQLIITGRYKDAGGATIRLSGMAAAKEKEFIYEATFSESNKGYDFIPLLWASRKIGYLLDVIRLEGKSDELVEEIVRLSKRYGIITEYTSFLAEEDSPIASPEDIIATARANIDYAYSYTGGSWAMSQSQNIVGMKLAAQAPTNIYLDEAGNQKEITGVNQVGSKAFYNKNDTWIDSEYSEEQDIIQVKVFSDAYFQLSRRFRQINKSLAQGQEVIIVLNNNAIEIGNEGREELFTEEELRVFGVDDVVEEEEQQTESHEDIGKMEEKKEEETESPHPFSPIYNYGFLNTYSALLLFPSVEITFPWSIVPQQRIPTWPVYSLVTSYEPFSSPLFTYAAFFSNKIDGSIAPFWWE
ncbi:MAG: VIT domain-containing protein [bacterium]